MDYSQLEKYTCTELRLMAEKMDLRIYRGKSDLIREITEAFREYEAYKKDKIDKYERCEQLGEKGKEGTTFLVRTKDGSEYAMKTFRKQKSSTNLRREADLQKMVATLGVSPQVIEIDTVSKYIVMEKLDLHFVDLLKQQNGILTKRQQKQIISIYKKMDRARVFHGDANLLNYMYKGDKLYIIDFGMAREITPSLIKKLGTETPNMHIMSLGMALKLRDLKCPSRSYSYIVKHLCEDQRSQFGFTCSDDSV
jgi:tRNA A-37 threonylcarbamoyl transferase component Bud32